MAEVVNELPEPNRGAPSTGSRYDKYLDGQVWKLTVEDAAGRAKDIISVRASIYEAARQKGGRVRCVTKGEDLYVWFEKEDDK